MWCMWCIVVTSTGPLQVMQRVRVTGIYTTIYHACFFSWYACGVQSSMWWMWYMYIVVTSTGPLQVMQRVRVN